MAQMALAWVLRDDAVTSALIGASRVSQIDDNVAALANLKFSRKNCKTSTVSSGPNSSAPPQ